ncbi:hypothetical protein [Wenyingzhuangia sp. 2_MG-2023]|uniref:hypothetical protein n=1 Tax=Wenyingzhuangia sp. 2_MG-2023 TaxID=3062639 RepID=UPI0026E195EF|nr:hypothetical protein [Wenyingzhuangia sp. 2_MG-2023]MDO6738777.1 hypothetical protein [Wenyingzhuangia sp. 2_MG-2023]
MKKIKIIIQVLSILTFLVGCDNDEVNSLENYNDATWTTSEFSNASGVDDIDFGVNTGDYISFVDLSQNALTHEWRIDEDNKFLNSGFTIGENLIPFINNDLGTVSTSKPAHVIFFKQGVSEVTLVNTFDKPVTYNGKTNIESVKKGDTYEITRTWKVDVYQEPVPAVSISKEDESGVVTELYNSINELVPADGVINIEAGESLIYEDITAVGRPNANSWKVSGSNEKSATNQKQMTFNFLKLGESEAGTLSVSRKGDEKNIPDAESVLFTIPLKIIISKSSKPFNIVENSVVRTGANKIAFDVNGELKAFTGQEANFKVHVTNTTSGFDSDLLVTKAEILAGGKTSIELTLDGDIYNTDEVKVTYTVGAETITSSDERDLTAFTDALVSFVDGDVFSSDYFGFELGGKEWFLQHPDQWSYNTSFSKSGNNSLMFSEPDVDSMPSNAKVQGTAATELKIDAGTYMYSIFIYIEPSTNLSKLITNFSGPWNPLTWDLTGVEKGTWVKLSTEITLGDYDNTGGGKLIFQINKADVSSDEATIYIDDLSLVPVETRP